MDDAPTVAARPAPWVLDALLGVAVSLVVAVVITADIEGSRPDAWAYLWAVALGALMLMRRRHPELVVVLSAAALLSYYVAGYPAIGVAVPLAAAVFSAAERGRMAASILVSTAVLAISVTYRLAAGQDPALVLGFDLPSHALLLAAAIAFGDSVRARREARAQSAEIATLLAERYAREVEQRAMSQRLAIARELHDSVGHALTVVTLHAQIADEALDADSGSHPEEHTLRDCLTVITDTTSATFDDLRRTVAGLRSQQATLREPLRIADLATAVLPAEQAGLAVTTDIRVREPLPPAVEATVYRIVQESITNVVRHAAASKVAVTVRQAGRSLEIVVIDDGGPTLAGPPGQGCGTGLAGMRERAALLGGTLTAGPEDTGFAVRASIPCEVTR